MEKEFVPYEQSLALKELGFDEPCIAWATMEYKGVVHCGIRFKIHQEFDLPTKPFGVPTWQSAFKWFREKYNLKDKYGIFPHHTIMFNYVLEGGKEEDAELACLKRLIEIVKSK